MQVSILAWNNNLRPSKEIRPVAPPTDAGELRRPLAIGLALSGLIALVVFVWGSVATLSGAVIANGVVGVDCSSKKIQPQQGGAIGESLLEAGTSVSPGAL